jgi:hypothetical protein
MISRGALSTPSAVRAAAPNLGLPSTVPSSAKLKPRVEDRTPESGGQQAVVTIEPLSLTPSL